MLIFFSVADVPLLQRSFELWKELDASYFTKKECDGVVNAKGLFHLCGGVMIGQPETEVVAGTLQSVAEHNLPAQTLDREAMAAKYPAFKLQPGEVGVCENNAGYLVPELCIEMNLNIARENGAELHFLEELISFEEVSDSGSIRVITNLGVYCCQKLIITAGAWTATPPLKTQLPVLSPPLQVVRRVLLWFQPDPGSEELFRNLPIYIWDTGADGQFYGFPDAGDCNGAVKVAYHFADLDDAVSRPEDLNRHVSEDEIESLRSVLKTRIPQLSHGKCEHSETCMYTMTADGHFIIDFHPTYEKKNVILASPCSGHGFKFCSVIGEILAEMAVLGQTKHEIGLFKIDRFLQK